jgi:hypothetical protein
LIRERFGCSLVEAIDVLDGHHHRLKAEQPNRRSSADDGGPGHQVAQEDQAVHQRRAADS